MRISTLILSLAALASATLFFLDFKGYFAKAKPVALSDPKLGFVTGASASSNVEPSNGSTKRERSPKDGARFGTLHGLDLRSPDKRLAEGGRILSKKDLPPMAQVL